MNSNPSAVDGVFSILFAAHTAAVSLDRSPLDFACQLPHLQRLGVAETELRYLTSKGLILHLAETTRPDDEARRFRPVPNLRLSEASSFVLSDAGLARCRLRASFPRQELPNGSTVSKPHYDQARRMLLLEDRIVKRFRVPAFNQELILRVFEEERWPSQILDPLPRRQGIEPKKRLHDAIYRLNSNQLQSLLAFEGDGTSKGILWRRIDVASTLD